MPLPMMVPTTMAEAWLTPRSRASCGAFSEARVDIGGVAVYGKDAGRIQKASPQGHRVPENGSHAEVANKILNRGERKKGVKGAEIKFAFSSDLLSWCPSGFCIASSPWRCCPSAI